MFTLKIVRTDENNTVIDEYISCSGFTVERRGLVTVIVIDTEPDCAQLVRVLGHISTEERELPKDHILSAPHYYTVCYVMEKGDTIDIIYAPTSSSLKNSLYLDDTPACRD